jgi:hypothetical protein
MKAYAIGRRGAARDYVDIEAAISRGGITLADIIAAAKSRFVLEGDCVFSDRLFLQQLVYTDDIHDTDLLTSPGTSFAEVERSLRSIVAQYIKDQLFVTRGAPEEVTLPDDIAELLWSYDPDKVDRQADAEIVVMAVLRLGSWEQIRWLFSYYGMDDVRRIIEKDYFGYRTLPVSIRVFWGTVFWPDSPPPELADSREQWRQTRLVVPSAALFVEAERLGRSL